MPTINQLVKKPRESKVKKSKSPHLGIGFNSLQKEYTMKKIRRLLIVQIQVI